MTSSNATHEQLASTASRPILDPTTSGAQKAAKDAAPKTAAQQRQEDADGEKAGTQEAEKHIRSMPIVGREEGEERAIGQVGKGMAGEGR